MLQERQSSFGEGGGSAAPLSILDASPNFSTPPASSSGASSRPQEPLRTQSDSRRSVDVNEGAGGFGPGQVAFPLIYTLSSAMSMHFKDALYAPTVHVFSTHTHAGLNELNVKDCLKHHTKHHQCITAVTKHARLLALPRVCGFGDGAKMFCHCSSSLAPGH